MERIDGVVGNVHDDDALAARRDEHADAGTLERVVVDADNRRRSRFRATTDAGTDVGVVIDRAAVSAGDVLLAEDDRMIVIVFEPREALAVTLPEATAERLEAAIELGHRIGNQHWDLAVEDGVVYVPLEADRHIVERVVADIVPGSAVHETTVEAELFVTDLEHAETDRAHDFERGAHAHEHSHREHSHEHGKHDTHRDHPHGARTNEHDHDH
ncbi:urease accessory protein UreE [Natronorubrum halophilum]|uniref:urease accessory protein UreE n=1 Tax=Natronorubrum halophilum TaxID=1702106 RepID=UPI000EF6F667|nr:urease accessory protein UreE [Natronorubrum halophilum]